MHEKYQIIFRKLAGFYFLFYLDLTFPMDIFLLPILASDIKTMEILLIVCSTNDVTHQRGASAKISNIHHWGLKPAPFKKLTHVLQCFNGWPMCLLARPWVLLQGHKQPRKAKNDIVRPKIDLVRPKIDLARPKTISQSQKLILQGQKRSRKAKNWSRKAKIDLARPKIDLARPKTISQG